MHAQQQQHNSDLYTLHGLRHVHLVLVGVQPHAVGAVVAMQLGLGVWT